MQLRKTYSEGHRRPRVSGATAFLLPAMIVLAGFDRGCVVKPPVDSIVTSSPVEVKGYIAEYDNAGKFIANHDGTAQLKVNNVLLPSVATVSKVWAYPAVPLVNGVNTLEGTTKRWYGGSIGIWIHGKIDPFLLERRSDIPYRGQQKVWLDMSHPNIDNKLKAIATGTLNGPLSATDLTTFTTGVRNGIKDFVATAYAGLDISVVNIPGVDTHEINFHGEDSCSIYGESPGDFKNLIKAQESKVYIGTFKCVALDPVMGLIAQTPAKKTDTLQTRIKDVATWIGRTAAHEFGHSLGLVAPALHGNPGWHNDPNYDATHPSDRFDNGHYMMDPGELSKLHARIGYCDPGDDLTTSRCRPRFNNFNRSYLEIIH